MALRARDSNGRGRRRRDSRVPTESFADIAFLLLIFFILTTTLIKTQGFLTEMPAGQKSEEEPEKTATVLVEPDSITLNDEPVTIGELRAALAKMNLHAKTGEDKAVLVEAKGQVTYETYFPVIAGITAAGGEVVILREGQEEGK